MIGKLVSHRSKSMSETKESGGSNPGMLVSGFINTIPDAPGNRSARSGQ